MKFITVVPAVRTIPGVEQFDYRVPEDADVAVGDLIRVPFRKKDLAAVVIAISNTSPFVDRAIEIPTISPIISFGDRFTALLASASERTFTSQPSVLASWIRTVPKRVLKKSQDGFAQQSSQPNLPVRVARFLLDRWRDPDGLIEEAKRPHGKTLILTPWLHRANILAREVGSPVLHSDLSDGIAWKAVHAFATGETQVLVATRIGAWLSCFADLVLMDEPENDDFKQDEMSPRLDARWVVTRAAELRPNISIISFCTTPRLKKQIDLQQNVVTIEPQLTSEIWNKRSGSHIETLSPQSLNHIQEAVDEQRAVFIVHPVRGERSKLACRDCGWSATCTFCQFHLSQLGNSAICKRCGRKAALPYECANCGGTDLSRGYPGKERLEAQCKTYFQNGNITVIDPVAFDELASAQKLSNALVIITDLSLIGGAAEDIRRKERLVIAWRRIATYVQSSNASLHVQGTEELVDECRSWLMKEGLFATWSKELRERAAFNYPPASPCVKILVDGSETDAARIAGELESALPEGWSIRGPFPVPFRSYTRKSRFVLHLLAPNGTSDRELAKMVEPFKKRGLIDLDPIAFFS